MESKRYNEEFIEILSKLSDIMMKNGQPFRAKAYQKAQESIVNYPDNITSVKQLNGVPGIGATISEKLNEYIETGTLQLIEREKTNPINILSDVYGIGPKKAEELVKLGVTSISELRKRQDELLNNVQKIGLTFYEDIQERIPRQEIVEYETLFNGIFSKLKGSNKKEKENTEINKFEIVGSYRRGASNSGDIDIIITGETGDVYNDFVDTLNNMNIILHILSRGPSKTLVIAKLPGANRVARRVDFLFSPPDEFPFAILYFTGSKIFNTIMRQKALDQGYTFNEHSIYHLTKDNNLTKDRKKGEKVDKHFRSEKDIFDFLGLEYKTPLDRQGSGPAATTQILNKEDDAEVQIKTFAKNGIKTLEKMSEAQLTDMLRYASKKYYNDEPVLTDNQFDIVKDYIEERYPTNAAIGEIGAEVERNKVKLPYLMASMDKIKPDTGALNAWKQRFKGPYILSCKLDGVSGLYTTEGPMPKLYTRGNGTIGQDISHLIPHLNLPKSKGIVIRGEFIISKDTFHSKYRDKFANPRNMVAGIINHKTVTSAVSDMHFVAYEVIKPDLKPSEQLAMLKKLKVETVLHEEMLPIVLTNEALSSILIDWRTNYKYEIDGVIVADNRIYLRQTAGNPEHAFAFKMVLSDQIAEAIVTDVIWTPSKDGYLKPRVQIEPINLGGVKIEYATGFNGAFIRDNKVGIGSTIQLIRSGDVIPHIKSVTVKAPEAKMPDVPFIWNDTQVDIMLEDAKADPTVREKNITGFFKGIEVEGLGEGNVSRIVQAGFDTVAKIIKMSEDDFLKVEGFKKTMASKIYTGIREKLQEATLVSLMAASNIFGRGFNNKKLELILNDYPNILTSTKTNNTKTTEVAAIKGMALKTAEAFVSKIEDFKEFLTECGLQNKLKKPKVVLVEVETDETHPLYNKTVVLTGTRDKTVIDILKNVGANQGASVSKNTHLVVAKSKDDGTGKAEEAKKLGITLMSVEEFITTYGLKK
jgi:DNA ligase (NAD+)